MIIHFCAFLCVASEDNALVSCRERVMRFFDISRERITRFLMSRERAARFFDMSRERITRFFDMSRERITCFFYVSREMDPRTSSGKFLRVEKRYP